MKSVLMNSVLRILLLTVVLWGPSVSASDNAGIFFYGTPPTPAGIEALAEGAQVSTSSDGAATRIVVEWPDVSLTISTAPDWNRSVQLSGIRGWVSRFPESERSSEAVVSFLAELERTTTAYGSIIAPGYDEEGKVVAFLKSCWVARADSSFRTSRSTPPPVGGSSVFPTIPTRWARSDDHARFRFDFVAGLRRSCMPPARNRREYGLTAADRAHEIARKFGAANAASVDALLAGVRNPTDPLLGAIVFLARPGHPDDIASLVAAANEDPASVLSAASTAEERRPW